MGAGSEPPAPTELTVWERSNTRKAFRETWRDFSCTDAFSVPLWPGDDIQAPYPHVPCRHSRPHSPMNTSPSRPLFFLFGGCSLSSAFAPPWTLTPASLCLSFPALLPGPAQVVPEYPPPPPEAVLAPGRHQRPCCPGHGYTCTRARPCLMSRAASSTSAGLGLGLLPLRRWCAGTGLTKEFPEGDRAPS